MSKRVRNPFGLREYRLDVDAIVARALKKAAKKEKRAKAAPPLDEFEQARSEAFGFLRERKQ